MININCKTGTNNNIFSQFFFSLIFLSLSRERMSGLFFCFSWLALKTSCSNVKCHETDFFVFFFFLLFFPRSGPSALVRTMQTHEFHFFYGTRDMGVLSHAYLCSLMHYGIGCQLPSLLKGLRV